MIELIFSDATARRLKRELRLAGDREIGGVLAAENLGGGAFRICAMSVQRTGGSSSSFIRDARIHRKFIHRFFSRTNYDYQRYNYIGEWHSHPSFVALPSGVDVSQMHALINEPTQAASFLVLVVVKAGATGGVEASAHAFKRGLRPMRIGVRGQLDSAIREAPMHGRASFRSAVALGKEITMLRKGGVEHVAQK